jgi:hypothetical protein
LLITFPKPEAVSPNMLPRSRSVSNVRLSCDCLVLIDSPAQKLCLKSIKGDSSNSVKEHCFRIVSQLHKMKIAWESDTDYMTPASVIKRFCVFLLWRPNFFVHTSFCLSLSIVDELNVAKSKQSQASLSLSFLFPFLLFLCYGPLSSIG